MPLQLDHKDMGDPYGRPPRMNPYALLAVLLFWGAVAVFCWRYLFR